ncbi:MAG: hypothetical protein AAF957_17130 [Planctomycetota bacterium]
MRSPFVRAVLALVPLVLIAAAALLLGRGTGDAPTSEVVQRSAPLADEPSGEGSALAPVDDESDAVRAAEQGSRVEEVVEPTASSRETEAKEGLITLFAGSIVLLDDDGSRVEDLSGVLHLMVWTELSGRGAKVNVVDGAFQLNVRNGVDGGLFQVDDWSALPGEIDELRCVCRSFKVEGRGAMLFCDPESGDALDEELSFPARTTGALLAVRPAPALMLHVRDGASGAALDRVEVRASTGGRHSRMVHPLGGRAESLVQDATSPVLLRPTAALAGKTAATLFVRAEGYAWKTATVGFLQAGERTVELVPAGALQMTFEGEVPRKAAFRLFSSDQGVPLCEIELRGRSELLLDALPPNGYDVRVELGPWYDDPILLAREEVEVLAGPATPVTLVLEQVDAVQTAQLAGTFILPPAWEDERPKLSLQRLTTSKTGANKYMMIRDGEFDAVDGMPGHFRFQRKLLETGRYELSYGEFDAKLIFDLPPEGRSDIVFEIGEPVALTVRVVDAATGADVTDVETISWSVTWPEGAWSGRSSSASRDEATGLFELRVPRGPIDISTFGDWSGSTEIPLATDGLRATLEVRQRSSAVIELRSGDQVLPWPSGVRWEVTAVEGEGRYNSSGTAGEERWFGVSEPGMYRVVIPPIDGFEPHEPIEIELVEGKRVRAVVELVPN